MQIDASLLASTTIRQRQFFKTIFQSGISSVPLSQTTFSHLWLLFSPPLPFFHAIFQKCACSRLLGGRPGSEWAAKLPNVNFPIGTSSGQLKWMKAFTRLFHPCVLSLRGGGRSRRSARLLPDSQASGETWRKEERSLLNLAGSSSPSGRKIFEAEPPLLHLCDDGETPAAPGPQLALLTCGLRPLLLPPTSSSGPLDHCLGAGGSSGSALLQEGAI